MAAPARLIPWVLAAIAGLAQAASIAAPWSGQPLWWLQLLSLALLVGMLRSQNTSRKAGLAGWLFALCWLAGTWWWLFVSMHVYGGLPAPLAALAVLLLAAFLGSYYAVAAVLYHRLDRGGVVSSALLFAGLWLLAELMRGVFLTGFPWGAGGYAHTDGPLAVLAPWVGVYGIGFVASLLTGLLGAWVGRPRRAWPAALAAPLVLLALAFWPPIRATHDTGRLSLALLQGNIAQDEKFQGGTGIPQALAWYGQQLLAARADLVVAPETAIPLLPKDLPQGYLDTLAAHFARGRQAALVGIPLGSFETGYTNSVIGLAPGGARYHYDKHHLVPFGEFIPPLFRWFTELMQIPLGDFNRGALVQPSFAWRGQRLAPNVCYEDLFGEEIGARFRDPARAPTVLVNVSNIAWFGDTIAIDQHLQISRMRALEFQRPVIRATNTGATAIIDAHGVVTELLPRLTRGVLRGEVTGTEGLTPFVRWVSAWGLAPLWWLGLALVALVALAGLAARRRGGH